MNEYTEQAERFLAETNTKFEIKYLRIGPYFLDDKYARYIYRFTLSNKRGSYTHEFGNSIKKAGLIPTAYDILSGLTCYTDPVFDNWCAEYGYNDLPLSSYPKIRAIYDDCLRESVALANMFTPEQLEQLQEIN